MAATQSPFVWHHARGDRQHCHPPRANTQAQSPSHPSGPRPLALALGDPGERGTRAPMSRGREALRGAGFFLMEGGSGAPSGSLGSCVSEEQSSRVLR